MYLLSHWFGGRNLRDGYLLTKSSKTETICMTKYYKKEVIVFITLL